MQVAVEDGGEVAGMELKYYAGKDVLDALLDCMERISKQDGADVIEVVRCKDCAIPHNRWTGCPQMNGTIMGPDDYCSYGRRKGGRGMTNKWIYCEEWWEGLTKFVTHHCPYCDCEVSNRKNDDLPDYCPNCGAKMGGEE